MKRKSMSLAEVRREGLRALEERLGPAGMIRFLRMYDSGNGDYTAERAELLKNQTVDQIVSRVKARRAKPARSRSASAR